MGNIRRAKHGPEWHIQRDLIRYLRDRHWHVERMIGNMFQEGIPDIYAFRRDFGSRWIDVKAPGKYSFTKAQRRKWPVWDSVGIGIWILTGANQTEYDKLFAAANWRDYWKDSWGSPDIDSLIDELIREEDEFLTSD
jgi:hypothetical protein